MRKLDIYKEDNLIYSIFLEKDFSALPERLEALSCRKKKALIVTDDQVAKLFLEDFKKTIEHSFSSIALCVLPAGEAHKDLEHIQSIYQAALDMELERKDMMIALGGGVVGDMTGFASATYLRGIDFIQVPTTLLAQVDSSIGGKTGVDFLQYKNLVGAFHMPKLVYSSMHCLLSLPKEQYASGMGEIIKHALIHNEKYLPYLEEHKEELKERKPEILLETIYQSNRVKKYFVEKDPYEHGDRKYLNFGHSLGHAIEKVANFTYSHGQCVAFGSLMALSLCKNITEEEIEEVKSLMEAMGLEIQCKALSISEILEALSKDKKQRNQHLQFVLLHHLCSPYIEEELSKDTIEDVLKQYMKSEEL